MTTPSQPNWDSFRSYLLFLAGHHLPDRLKGKVEAGDLVQQTLLQACQKGDQYRGNSDAEAAAYLRTILKRLIVDLYRTYYSEKRDAELERSLDVSFEQSSIFAEGILQSPPSSPSRRAMRYEEADQLNQALRQLPEDQLQAIRLRHMQNLSVEQTAQAMDKTHAAVAGLLRRGLKRLRELMGPREQDS